MPLSVVAISKAKPKDKPYKMFDGGGLYLFVQPTGAKWWRYKYRFAGKEKVLPIGVFPEVDLRAARDRHFQARKDVEAGIDPAEKKREVKRHARLAAEHSFESIAREWCESRRP